jgi:hypothetical protein
MLLKKPVEKTVEICSFQRVWRRKRLAISIEMSLSLTEASGGPRIVLPGTVVWYLYTAEKAHARYHSRRS